MDSYQSHSPNHFPSSADSPVFYNVPSSMVRRHHRSLQNFHNYGSYDNVPIHHYDTSNSCNELPINYTVSWPQDSYLNDERTLDYDIVSHRKQFSRSAYRTFDDGTVSVVKHSSRRANLPARDKLCVNRNPNSKTREIIPSSMSPSYCSVYQRITNLRKSHSLITESGITDLEYDSDSGWMAKPVCNLLYCSSQAALRRSKPQRTPPPITDDLSTPNFDENELVERLEALKTTECSDQCTNQCPENCNGGSRCPADEYVLNGLDLCDANLNRNSSRRRSRKSFSVNNARSNSNKHQYDPTSSTSSHPYVKQYSEYDYRLGSGNGRDPYKDGRGRERDRNLSDRDSRDRDDSFNRSLSNTEGTPEDRNGNFSFYL